MVVGGVIIASVASCVATPFAHMVRRGTLDQQKLAAIRAEVAVRGSALAPGPRREVAIPAPRTSTENAALVA